jgi:FixJ family two-component response regulator
LPSASIKHLQFHVKELRTHNRVLKNTIKDLHKKIRALEDCKCSAEHENLANLALFCAAIHSLRQPLQAINLVQGVLASPLQDESARKAAGRLKRAVANMARKLDKLEAVSRAKLLGVAPPALTLAKPAPEAHRCACQGDQGAGAHRTSPTLYVVDDDQAILDAARALLEGAGYAVEIFASGSEFLEAHTPCGEECVLVDALMPEMDGFELIERLKAAGHEFPIIMITGNGDMQMAIRAMRTGAADFIEKPISADELLSAIERALDRTPDAARRETAAARVAILSARERQILILVLEGQPSKNIAADLGLSQRTVENHRAAIMRKTGARSVAQLVRLVLAAE